MITAKLSRSSNAFPSAMTQIAARTAEAAAVDRKAREKSIISHWQQPQLLWPTFTKG